MKNTPLILALDIGNVCVNIDYSRFASLFAAPVLPEAAKAALQDFECGRIDEKSFFDIITAAGEDRFTRAEAVEAFESVLYKPVDGMRELVSTFPARNIRAYFLSDISTTHLRRTRNIFPEAELVTDGIFSYSAGALKPSPPMLAGFEKKFGKPDLYTDDRQELISAAAGEYSWNTYCFTSAAGLDAALRELEKR